MRSSSFAGMIQLADATPLSPFAATACALRHASIPAALFNDLGCYCGSALNVAKRGLPIDETDHCCYVYDTCVQDSSEANCNSPDETFDALCVDGDDTVVCLDETSKCCKCVRILAQCIRQAVEFHDVAHFAPLVDASDPEDDAVCYPVDEESRARKTALLHRMDVADALEQISTMWTEAKAARAAWKEGAALHTYASEAVENVETNLVKSAEKEMTEKLHAEIENARGALRSRLAGVVSSLADAIQNNKQLSSLLLSQAIPVDNGGSNDDDGKEEAQQEEGLR
ncbi:secretory phospholipase A2 [Pycnococcus provasolii]